MSAEIADATYVREGRPSQTVVSAVCRTRPAVLFLLGEGRKRFARGDNAATVLHMGQPDRADRDVRRAVLFGCAVAVLLAAGCMKHPQPDLPIYPDAQGVKSGGKLLGANTTVFQQRWLTPAAMSQVVAFYDQKVLTRPRWTKSGDGHERVVYTDGNMGSSSAVGGNDYWPVDESKPGGLVELLAQGDRAVLIGLCQAFPKKP
jgi:hypothetical protein